MSRNMDDIEFKNLKIQKTTIFARQILLYFVDFFRFVLPIFDKRRVYRIPFKLYDKFRSEDKEKFRREIYRLERAGFIKRYFVGKELYLELRPKGKKQLKSYLTWDLKIKSPRQWDRKWRIVIYDISNDKKDKREIIRKKLEQLGFLKLQESVYVYPFGCSKEINLLKNMYFISPHVQYITADRIETEVDLIKKFYNRRILTKNMLK